MRMLFQALRLAKREGGLIHYVHSNRQSGVSSEAFLLAVRTVVIRRSFGTNVS